MQISIIGIALVMAFGCVPFLAQTKGKGKASFTRFRYGLELLPRYSLRQVLH